MLISALMTLANFYEEGIVCVQDFNNAINLYNRALDICINELDSYKGLPPFYVDYDHIDYLESQINEITEKKKKIDTKPKKCYLFFDVETTGVPKNWKASITDSDNWPRLVQIAWLLYDENENLLESKSEIIKPENFIIPKNASNIHGITTEFAIQNGKNLSKVLDNFKKALEQSSLIIAHNISFDKSIVGAEYYRLYKTKPLSNIKSFCTMVSTTNICRIDGVYGYKFPKLQELHYFLFHQNFEFAHDAMVDTTATAKCYFELKRKNIL
jgi:DNA polymerase III epsilon subunit-like protein